MPRSAASFRISIDLKLIEEVDVPVPANWKVIQENSIEGYHFDNSGPAHKQLVQLIDFAGYALKPRGEWWTYIGPPKKDATHAYGLPLEGATWQTDWFFNFGLWPNATIYAFPYADMVGTFIMNPTGPESSMLRFGYYGVEGRDLPAGHQGLHPLDERGARAGGHPPQQIEPAGTAVLRLRREAATSSATASPIAASTWCATSTNSATTRSAPEAASPCRRRSSTTSSSAQAQRAAFWRHA